MEYIDPAGSVGDPTKPYEAKLGSGPARVALLSNAFADCRRFLDLVARAMSSDAPELEFKIFEKPTPVGQAPQAIIDEVASYADAVVAAIGHCGSCTSGTVRDAIAFARLDMPAVALVTEKFWDEGSFVAAGGGMPDVPRVLLPYPVAGQDAETLEAIASGCAPAVLAALHGEG